ncbi:MAG: Spy/CpxP family protein refolding chaperone [Candidatus Hydrothermia bacterium]
MTGIILSALLNIGGPGFGMLMNPWVQEELGLTTDQAENLTKIVSDHMTSTATLRADLMAKRIELRTELGKDKPDMKKVEKLTGDISALQAKLMMERIRMEIAVKGVLTAEQRAKLGELMASKPGMGKGGNTGAGKWGKGRRGKGFCPMWF